MPPASAAMPSQVILVVEDHPPLLTALSEILEEAGFQVVPTANGREALKSFANSRPDLILSDITMPILNGFELFHEIRKTREGRRIPFVFLTARGRRQDILAGIALGVDAYLTKPITAQELLTTITSRLTRFAELREAFR